MKNSALTLYYIQTVAIIGAAQHLHCIQHVLYTNAQNVLLLLFVYNNNKMNLNVFFTKI